MASSDINIANSDILTCSICLEIFTKPKYLPCLHTFCESCISTYINSGFEKGNTESIECPVCRGHVFSPKENCQPNEWARMLPLNFLISGLIEKQKLTRAEKMCMLCERFSGKTAAKASFVCVQCTDTLCDTCEKYHKCIKVLSDHDVKPLDDTSFSDLPFDTFKSTCSTHTGKLLELYCYDHDAACCSICISIDHRKCVKVVTLEDAAKDISSSADIEDLKRELQNICIDTESIITNQKCNLQAFTNQYEREQKNTEEIFQSLRDTVNRQEQLRKAELSKVFNEKKGIIETNITISENKKKSIQNEQRLLDISVSKASDAQLMIELKKLQSRRDQHKKELTAECKDLQNFNIASKNTDKSIIEKQIMDICEVQCEEEPCLITIKSIRDNAYQFTRFGNIGPNKSWWKVESKPDAVLFTVSERISLFGFISYGCKNSAEALEVDATLKKGSIILGQMKTTFTGEKFQDNVTKLYLQHPVDISPGIQHEVVFVMKSSGLCNYGVDGNEEVKYKGVVFQFSESSESKNGTNGTKGQIPGFLFQTL